jgi:hypothetical protein
MGESPYSGSGGPGRNISRRKRQMIYCVIPEVLADELQDKLRDYYKDEPNVEVIIDRRRGERRSGSEGGGKREVRDRRRRRASGSFPKIDVG